MRIAGLGFRDCATMADLRAALHRAEAQAGHVQALATVEAKAAHPALLAFAAERALPVLAVRVADVATPTQSAASLTAHRTGSVAEAAALASFPGAWLLMTRTISANATCAIAEAGLSAGNLREKIRKGRGRAPAKSKEEP